MTEKCFCGTDHQAEYERARAEAAEAELVQARRDLERLVLARAAAEAKVKRPKEAEDD